eukprot:TRINITY_DN12703_c0_g1_i1.p1 TRINITY_DN12703_c0_g1~~TRINITY_DN12703_c0_g1_i1.p1  ORF type:complete len:643 (-),score=124.94 TRINITY_DN12703_c0_g1_i1:41-1969(-)
MSRKEQPPHLALDYAVSQYRRLDPRNSYAGNVAVDPALSASLHKLDNRLDDILRRSDGDSTPRRGGDECEASTAASSGQMPMFESFSDNSPRGLPRYSNGGGSSPRFRYNGISSSNLADCPSPSRSSRASPVVYETMPLEASTAASTGQAPPGSMFESFSDKSPRSLPRDNSNGGGRSPRFRYDGISTPKVADSPSPSKSSRASPVVYETMPSEVAKRLGLPLAESMSQHRATGAALAGRIGVDPVLQSQFDTLDQTLGKLVSDGAPLPALLSPPPKGSALSADTGRASPTGRATRGIRASSGHRAPSTSPTQGGRLATAISPMPGSPTSRFSPGGGGGDGKSASAKFLTELLAGMEDKAISSAEAARTFEEGFRLRVEAAGSSPSKGAEPPRTPRSRRDPSTSKRSGTLTSPVGLAAAAAGSRSPRNVGATGGGTGVLGGLGGSFANPHMVGTPRGGIVAGGPQLLGGGSGNGGDRHELRARVLARSLEGLASSVVKWSASMPGLEERDRQDLIEMVLGYVQPCASADANVERLVGELQEARIQGKVSASISVAEQQVSAWSPVQAVRSPPPPPSPPPALPSNSAELLQSRRDALDSGKATLPAPLSSTQLMSALSQEDFSPPPRISPTRQTSGLRHGRFE